MPKLFNEPAKIGMKIFGLGKGEMLKFAAFVINPGSEIVMKTESRFRFFLIYFYFKSWQHVESRFFRFLVFYLTMIFPRFFFQKSRLT